jgi:3-hydroxy acid dehydrogenase / malonic semialdehyde reductase
MSRGDQPVRSLQTRCGMVDPPLAPRAAARPPYNTVLITGATAGMGKAIAKRFHHGGFKVIVTGRRIDRLRKLRDALGSQNVHAAALDVRQKGAMQDLLANLPDTFSEIDVLVNNAGIALGLDPAPTADPKDWEDMIETNIKGVSYCTAALLPSMCRRNRGHIINIGSIAATYPYAGGNCYGATKAYIQQFSLNLRAELAAYDVRVTVIEPGRTQTELAFIRFKGDEKRAQALYEEVPSLQAEDIAETAYWCACQPAHVNINRVELMPVFQKFEGPSPCKLKTFQVD